MASATLGKPQVSARGAFPWQFVLLTGLSVSIGWGIRGQFGHQNGAALAGALGGMAVALLSGRSDWWRRVHFFALFGAIGWAFGGTMSYMKTLAYTHSSDPVTLIYGFFCLFLLGFLWAAPGGAGTAVSVFWNREQLTRLCVLLCAVVSVWYAKDFIGSTVLLFGGPWPRFLNSDEGSALLAGLVALIFTRRSGLRGLGSTLVLYMSAGWWAGYLILNVLLQLKMNPPRPEGWTACVGLVAGILVFCWRNRQGGLGFATVTTGFLGGIGFVLGQLVKILCISTGLHTNWHSVMEQTQGLFHGLAIAVPFGLLVVRAPRIGSETPVRRWTEVFSVAFVLWVLTYINFRLSPGEWTKEIKSMTPYLYGIPINGNLLPGQGFLGWLDIVSVAVGLAMVWALVQHVRHGLPFVPSNWLGKGQLMYLVFLWTLVWVNFALVLPRFTPMRLVTEWVIALNAVICTVVLLHGALRIGIRDSHTPATDRPYAPWIRRAALLGVAGTILACFGSWGIKRAVYGDHVVPGSNTDQIRFGPDNTNTIR